MVSLTHLKAGLLSPQIVAILLYGTWKSLKASLAPSYLHPRCHSQLINEAIPQSAALWAESPFKHSVCSECCTARRRPRLGINDWWFLKVGGACTIFSIREFSIQDDVSALPPHGRSLGTSSSFNHRENRFCHFSSVTSTDTVAPAHRVSLTFVVY